MKPNFITSLRFTKCVHYNAPKLESRTIIENKQIKNTSPSLIFFRWSFKFYYKKLCLTSLIVSCLMWQCKNKSINQEPFQATLPTTLFTSLDSTQTNILFKNEVIELQDFNILNYRNFYNGGGVGIGDINNDSLPDVFFHVQFVS